jgi:hypothetical protein
LKDWLESGLAFQRRTIRRPQKKAGINGTDLSYRASGSADLHRPAGVFNFAALKPAAYNPYKLLQEVTICLQKNDQTPLGAGWSENLSDEKPQDLLLSKNHSEDLSDSFSKSEQCGG